MDGFLVIDKPMGVTSSACVARVRRRLGRNTPVGHGGTLDPMATGVLPVCVGAATRLFDYIIDKKKTYVAELRLGVETDTQDATGATVRTCAVEVGEDAVRAALRPFVGEILQTPPMYSAIKRNGERMYDLARRGERVELAPRPCRVDDIRLVRALAPDRYQLEVDCGKGVYIRTLCHDIGALLGCGGHMAALRRTRAGAFCLEGALSLEEVDEMDAAGLAARLTPMDAAVGHLPAVRVAQDRRGAVLNGSPLPEAWLDAPAPRGKPVRVYVGSDFAGMGQAREDGSVRFLCMLLRRG